MTLQTYLFFPGNCEEAIGFYRKVFGAELVFLMRFKEGPAELNTPGSEEKVFHATLRFGETKLNMADVPSTDNGAFGGFALLTHFDTVEEGERVFQELAKGGGVSLPFEPTFWAARYGIVTDAFGLTWKIQVDR